MTFRGKDAMNLETLKIHRFAAMFPPIDSETFNLLRDSIGGGWDDAHPIVLYQGQVLDGRNRLFACIDFNRHHPDRAITPTFREFEGDGDAAFLFVLRENLYRRNMTKGECAVVVLEAEEMLRKRPSRPQELAHKCATPSGKAEVSIPETVRIFESAQNVSRRTVEQLKELKKLDPEGFNRVATQKKSVLSELKKAKAKLPQIAPESKPDLDAEGIPVHPKAAEALTEGRRIIRALTNDLHAAYRRVEELSGTPLGRRVNKSTLLVDFKNITAHLSSAMPYSSCPMSQDCPRECKLCQGTQWITKTQFDSLPPTFKPVKVKA